MLIISYVVKKTYRDGGSLIIDMCGQFNDWDHFERFSKVEAQRGWKVLSHSLVKEVTDGMAEG